MAAPMGVMRASPLVATLFLLVLLVPAAVPQSAEHGATAPENRWTVRGGCPARTGASLTPPLPGPIETAWEYRAPGEIMGEPLVWDDRIVLEVKTGTRRDLQLIRLADGERLAMFKGGDLDQPLAPSLWGRLVVFRVAPMELVVARLKESRIKRMWEIRSAKPFGEPLLLGREIYVRVGDEQIHRYDIPRESPVWTAKGTYRSELAIRGDSVYVIQYRERRGSLTRLDRRSGKVVERVEIAAHGYRIPATDTKARLRVGRRHVLVRHQLPVLYAGGQKLNGSTVLREVRKDGRVKLTEGPPLEFEKSFDEPRLALALDGWVGRARLPKKGPVLGYLKDDREFLPYATRTDHAELMQLETAPTCARNVAYLGTCAVEIDTAQILWRRSLRPTSRLIPARGMVLAVVAGNALVAMKPKPGAARGFFRKGTVSGPARATAWLRDGTSHTGVFRVTENELVEIVTRGEVKSERSRPLPDVLYAESESEVPVYYDAQDDVVRFANRLQEAHLSRGYAKLAADAASTRDPALIGRLLGEAWQRGADNKKLESVERSLNKLLKRPRKINAARVKKVRADEAALLASSADILWRRVNKLDDKVHSTAKLGFLRALLELDPKHSEATAAVRAMLPEGLRPKAGFEPLDWLDLVQAVQVTPVSVVEARISSERKTPEQLSLLRARRAWRKDLIGIQSGRLLIISSLARPGRIARTLSMGELVCDKLEAVFAAARKQRMTFRRMEIWLCENQQEYMALMGDPKGDSHVRWSAGHYDDGWRCSRMFVPEGKEAFARVHRVFAHELTHQWIEERCPVIIEQERVLDRVLVPGFWIVEGIASFVEEFRYDPELGKVDEANPRSETIDILGALLERGGAPLIPWKALFAYSQYGMHRKTSPKPDARVTVHSHWRLGTAAPLSPMNLFYLQATAACHYLYHAENGKYRQRLIRYVGDHYMGRKANLSVEKAFGLTPEELGRRSLDWVRQKAKQYRP